MSLTGHLCTNAAGANLNWEWAKPSLDRSPEVVISTNAMIITTLMAMMMMILTSTMIVISSINAKYVWHKSFLASLTLFGRRLPAWHLFTEVQSISRYQVRETKQGFLQTMSEKIHVLHESARLAMRMP